MDPLTIPPRKIHSDTLSGGVEPSTHTSPNPAQEAPQKQSGDSFIVEVFKFAVLALVIVVPFRLFIAQPFIVSGASMAPTFETGEYLIIDQVSYRFENPHRGDVIIFRFPNDPSKYFIKRIIGLPGEVVELANGYATIENPSTGEQTKLDEQYLVTDRTDDHLSITLASDEYFVMGDNRSASSDSRMWGPVPRKNIVGKALVRLLPPRHFALYPGEYRYTTPLLNFDSQQN
jgi:signal peptidase I